MGQRNRLRLLQMGKTRHKGFRIGFHDHKKLLQQLLYQAVNLVNFISGIELHIKSHLIVAATACVKTLSSLSNTLRKSSLHKRMDVFITGIRRNGQCSLIQIPADALQPFDDIISVLFRKNSLLCQHLYMGNAASDILTVKFLVK